MGTFFQSKSLNFSFLSCCPLCKELCIDTETVMCIIAFPELCRLSVLLMHFTASSGCAGIWRNEEVFHHRLQRSMQCTLIASVSLFQCKCADVIMWTSLFASAGSARHGLCGAFMSPLAVWLCCLCLSVLWGCGVWESERWLICCTPHRQPGHIWAARKSFFFFFSLLACEVERNRRCSDNVMSALTFSFSSCALFHIKEPLIPALWCVLSIIKTPYVLCSALQGFLYSGKTSWFILYDEWSTDIHTSVSFLHRCTHAHTRTFIQHVLSLFVKQQDVFVVGVTARWIHTKWCCLSYHFVVVVYCKSHLKERTHFCIGVSVHVCVCAQKWEEVGNRVEM